MKKYAYANNDGDCWCSKTREDRIEESGTCEHCQHREECESHDNK